MSKLRILFISALLLLCQSGLLLHELDADHYAEAHSQCELCLSENGLDNALSATGSAVPVPPWRNADRLSQLTFAISSRSSIYYQSRAPPFV